MSGVKALVQRLEKSQGFGSAAKRNALNTIGSPSHQTSTPIKSAGITQPQLHPSPKVQGWCVQVEGQSVHIALGKIMKFEAWQFITHFSFSLPLF